MSRQMVIPNIESPESPDTHIKLSAHQAPHRLRLQQLMTHDQVRSTDAGAEKRDEHGGQLVLVVNGKRQVLRSRKSPTHTHTHSQHDNQTYTQREVMGKLHKSCLLLACSNIYRAGNSAIAAEADRTLHHVAGGHFQDLVEHFGMIVFLVRRTICCRRIVDFE